MSTVPILTILIAVPLVAGALCLLVRAEGARWIALVATLATFVTFTDLTGLVAFAGLEALLAGAALAGFAAAGGALVRVADFGLVTFALATILSPPPGSPVLFHASVIQL